MKLEQTELLDLVDVWHSQEAQSNSGETLYAFLGWSWEDYQSWVLNDEAPEQEDEVVKALRKKLAEFKKLH